MAYWKFNGDVKDVMSGISLFNQQNTSFVLDRRNHSRSALFLNSGYAQIPRKMYFFGPDFTIAFWIYQTKQIGASQTIMLFEDDQSNHVLELQYLYYGSIIFDGLGNFFVLYDTTGFVNVPYGNWRHFIFTSANRTMSIYELGIFMGSRKGSSFSSVNTIGFFGNVNAYLDDVMIFNRSMDVLEIMSVLRYGDASLINSATSTRVINYFFQLCCSIIVTYLLNFFSNI